MRSTATHEHAVTATAPIGFAHRGGRGVARENTVEAFAAALSAGAAGLESDAWLTADDVPVLDHGGRVRTGSGRRRWIRDLPRADLPDHIPTLDELYSSCGAGFELSLDILDPRAAARAVAVARQHDAGRRLWLVGPWPQVGRLRGVDADVHVVATVAWYRLGPGARRLLRTVRASGACAINLPFWLWTPGLVRAVHACGLLAFGWRANTALEIRWLRRCGCDGVYSDSVRALVAAGLARASGLSGI